RGPSTVDRGPWTVDRGPWTVDRRLRTQGSDDIANSNTCLIRLFNIMKQAIQLLVLLAVGGGVYWYTSRPVTSLVLTGIVTTNHIVVSPQITGRLDKLMVAEGDVVKADQLLAVLEPDELRQERAYYSFSA